MNHPHFLPPIVGPVIPVQPLKGPIVKSGRKSALNLLPGPLNQVGLASLGSNLHMIWKHCLTQVNAGPQNDEEDVLIGRDAVQKHVGRDYRLFLFNFPEVVSHVMKVFCHLPLL